LNSDADERYTDEFLSNVNFILEFTGVIWFELKPDFHSWHSHRKSNVFGVARF